MQNKYKLPPDVRRVAIGIVQGQDRRIRNKHSGNINNNESVLIESVSNALNEVCADIQSSELKRDLKSALIQNCVNKSNVYEHFYLPGISRKSFYNRKNRMLYLIAKVNNII